jgi:outer membrane protein assembly factor BamB
VLQQPAAQDWPQWRGPKRDGEVATFKAPAAWPEKLKLLWKTDVGNGMSSPVVSHGKAWIHTRKVDDEVVSCVDLKTGKILWSKTYPAPFVNHPGAAKAGKGPFATPLLAEGRLYTLGVSAILSSFDANTGELKWRKDFGPINTTTIFCGTTASPLYDRGEVIVMVGDDRSGALIAFDPATGNERWKWTTDSVSYSSPVIASLGGTRQIVVHTNNAVVGIDRAAVRVLWKMPFIDPPYGENIITPIIRGDMLIVSNGTQGVTALSVENKGGQWGVKESWRNKDMTMYMSSPVLAGEHLFGMSAKQKGRFFLLEATTGKVLWATSGRDGETASVFRAGDLFITVTDDAKLTVVKKSLKSLEPAATYSVATTPVWAQPAIWNKNILVKDEASLALWSLD